VAGWFGQHWYRLDCGQHTATFDACLFNIIINLNCLLLEEMEILYVPVSVDERGIVSVEDYIQGIAVGVVWSPSWCNKSSINTLCVTTVTQRLKTLWSIILYSTNIVRPNLTVRSAASTHLPHIVPRQQIFVLVPPPNHLTKFGHGVFLHPV